MDLCAGAIAESARRPVGWVLALRPSARASPPATPLPLLCVLPLVPPPRAKKCTQACCTPTASALERQPHSAEPGARLMCRCPRCLSRCTCMPLRWGGGGGGGAWCVPRALISRQPRSRTAPTYPPSAATAAAPRPPPHTHPWHHSPFLTRQFQEGVPTAPLYLHEEQPSASGPSSQLAWLQQSCARGVNPGGAGGGGGRVGGGRVCVWGGGGGGGRAWAGERAGEGAAGASRSPRGGSWRCSRLGCPSCSCTFLTGTCT